MSNGVPPCCPLEICCDAPAAKAALVKKFMDHGCSEDVASSCAGYIKEEFALAPKSFQAVIADIVRMAKQHG